MEAHVSSAIGAMHFLWLPIEDEPGPHSDRGVVERGAIALLSNYDATPLDPPSDGWLGRDCPRPRVRASGLWNQNHVDEAYDRDFLDVFEALLDGTRVAKTPVVEPNPVLAGRGRGVPEPRFANLVPSTTTRRQPSKPSVQDRSSVPETPELAPTELSSTLIILPCSGSKARFTGQRVQAPGILDRLPSDLAAELEAARRAVRERASVDEGSMVPAWQRYTGNLYRAAGPSIEEAVQRCPVLILSGGYGVVEATEPIGYYEAVFKPGWWPRGLLERVLAAYSESVGATSVRAFASTSTAYRKPIERTRWGAQMTDGLLLMPQVQGGGGMVKAPRAQGQALQGVLAGGLPYGWVSSDGVPLSAVRLAS